MLKNLVVPSAILCVMGFLATGSIDDSNESDAFDAWVMAQEFVKDRLKSPGSASFGSVLKDYQDPKDCVSELGDGRFRCRGWVDAQNTFGGLVRTNFDCVIRHDKDGKWYLESIELLNR